MDAEPTRNRPTSGHAAKATPERRRRLWLDPLAAFLAAAAYFVLVLGLYPRAEVFEFDPDEGNRVLMSRMVDRGHALYSEIWNDQPPLFTFVPMWWCRAVGWDVDHVRLLVLLCATGLVFAVYDSVRLVRGHKAAVAAVALLPCSMYFMRLSVSAMVGLPAIALTMMCVWALLRWSSGRYLGWLVTGGVCMGLALMTKLFTGFLLPLLALWLLLVALGQRPKAGGRLKTLLPPVSWLLCVAATAGAVLLLLVPLEQVEQLYGAHARSRALYEDYGSRSMLLGNIAADWELFGLAAIGCLQAALRRRSMALVFSLWGLAGFVVLWGHSPVWYHHHLLLSVPACAIAGVAVAEAVRRDWRPRREWRALLQLGSRLVTAVLVALLVVGLARGQKHDVPRKVFDDGDDHRLVLKLMQAYGDPGTVVVADRQMYAARADFAVPPDLCVTSDKRLRSGGLTAAEVVEQIVEHNPRQIVLSRGLYRLRDQIMPPVESAGRRYVLAYARRNFVQMYVRADVAADPLAVLSRVVEQSPPLPAAHDYIGLARLRRGESAAALDAFRRANAIDPTYPDACRHLAQMHMSAGDYARGFAILKTGLETASSDRYAYIARVYAWRRATCPDEAQRDGAEAERVIAAIVRAEGTATPADLEIGAAALAAQGRFDQAASAAGRVAELARRRGAARAVRRIERQLQAYRGHQMRLEKPRPPRD